MSVARKRHSTKAVVLKTAVPCKVYPVSSSMPFKTVGLRLDREQTILLVAQLQLAIAGGWETIDLTAYREEQVVTITNPDGE